MQWLFTNSIDAFVFAAYDFTGRNQYQINRLPRQTVQDSFHFPTSDNDHRGEHVEYGGVAYAEGRNAKSGRRAKLPAEFQEPVPEVQTEYPPVGTEEARYLSPQAFAKISETLGAINTVGRYLVNYTRGTTDDRLDSPQNYPVSKYIFIESNITCTYIIRNYRTIILKSFRNVFTKSEGNKFIDFSRYFEEEKNTQSQTHVFSSKAIMAIMTFYRGIITYLTRCTIRKFELIYHRENGSLVGSGVMKVKIMLLLTILPFQIQDHHGHFFFFQIVFTERFNFFVVVGGG